MILAVISDVHANKDALSAIIKELEKFSPDKWVFLGDLVGVGAYPEETVQAVRKVENAVFVKGNHDLFASDGVSPYKREDIRDKFIRWQNKALSAYSKNFLKAMPETASFTAEGKTVTCLHYPKAENGWFKIPKYLPTDRDIERIFDGVKGDIVLFGHEHTGSFHEINGRYFLNFGTAGHYLSPNTARGGIVEISPEKVVYKAINAVYDDFPSRKRSEEILKLLSER